MCLPDFVEFKQIKEENALIGYRNWRLPIKNPTILISENQDYEWHKMIEGPHEITKQNSGIYAYNYYYNYNYNYYYYYNYNYNYYYNYYYNYNIVGVIKQYGKVGVHQIGQRSEYAKINKLFTIRESDAKGTQEFLDWIKKFNVIIIELSKKYECEIISWQDFLENEKK